MPHHRLTIQGTLNGQLAVNVFHYDPTTVPYGSPQQLCEDWETAIKGAYLDCVSQHYDLVMLKAVDLSTQAFYEKGVSGSGTRLGEACPPQCAAVISWRTGTASRRGRGRNYIPGIAEIDQTGGTIGATLLANLEILAALATSFTVGNRTYELVVYSRLDNQFRLVNSGVVRGTVFTQRRRAIGAGG